MKKFLIILISCVLFTLLLFSDTTMAWDDECNEEENQKVILIDPGHGGIDGGAKSKNGTIEKEINLQIALKLKESLEQSGYKVYMTREDDKGLYQEGKTTVREKKREDLKKRAKMKVETKCDAFISIHQNMFPQSNCYGAQVWYASNEESAILAKAIQTTLKEKIDNNNKRVEKPAGEAYLILRDKYVGASILVECGFLSNPDEENKLKTDEYQQQLVLAISLGVERYFKGEFDEKGILE